MKYLENEKLAQITAQLTDVSIGTGDRTINGRIEAFTMKRAGTDKKYAHALGEKFQQEMELAESEVLAQLQKSINGTANATSAKAPPRVTLMTPTPPTTTLKPKRGERRIKPRSVSIGDVTEFSTINPASTNSKKHPLSSSSSSDVKNSRRRSNSTGSTQLSNLSTTLIGVLKPSRIRSASDLCLNYTPFSNSPLGDLHSSNTRRLMTDLIMTLNASFPDYDFSNVKPTHFTRLPSPTVAINRTNEKLSQMATEIQQHSVDRVNYVLGGEQDGDFLTKLWSAVDDAIVLHECEVYSYVPPSGDDDDDPLGFLTQSLDDDSDNVVPLWTFNFFFVNKSLKRIVLFTCVQTMKNEVEENDTMMMMGLGDSYAVGDYDASGGLGSGLDTSFDYGNGSGYRIFDSNAGASGYTSVDDDEDSYYQDYDMDTDGMGQAVNAPPPPTTVV